MGGVQAPFITLFMYINEAKNEQEKKDLVMLIEEVLKQSMQGVKNEQGVWITPAFPKIIYVLQEDNITEDSPYWYLTEMAAKCSIKRLTPDYISEKVMKEMKDGNCYPVMGCVDGEEVVMYKFNNYTYVESFRRMWDRFSDYFTVRHQYYNKDNVNLYMDLEDVYIYDTKKGYVRAERINRNVSSQWVDVHLSNGRRLICTSDHVMSIIKKNGESTNTHANKLNKGDKISISTHYINLLPKEMGFKYSYNLDKAWLMGLILCDGCFSNPNRLTVSIAAKGEDDIEDTFHKTFFKTFGVHTKTEPKKRGIKGNYKDLVTIPDGDEVNKAVTSYLINMFDGIKKTNRHIPNEVFNWEYESRLAFLAGMMDADGYIDNKSVAQLGSTNKELALQQMVLIQTLGMPARMYYNHYTKKKPDAIRYKIDFYPSKDLIYYMACEKKKKNFKEYARESQTHDMYAEVISVKPIEKNDFSYDVTTVSSHFEVSGIYSHNCRSALTVWNDENDKPKFYGRFNSGVVTVSLPDIALSSKGDMDKFWEIFDERMELCHEALKIRHKRLRGVSTNVAPILWQHGALARLGKEDTIDKLLFGGYSTLSLGYAGLYECVMYMTGHSHSDEGIGEEFGLKVMQALNDACAKWKSEESIDYSLYGTPLESTTEKFAKKLKERFGVIEGITDRNYITNSYHIPVFEHIDAFRKLYLESKFQRLSPGGSISYIEAPNMDNNIEAVIEIIKYIYDHNMYAEINTKSDYCQKCGWDKEINLIDEDGKLIWECPNCGNRDVKTMDITRRTCGYKGTARNGWNQGRLGDIHDRVLHLDDIEEDI